MHILAPPLHIYNIVEDGAASKCIIGVGPFSVSITLNCDIFYKFFLTDSSDRNLGLFISTNNDKFSIRNCKTESGKLRWQL